jgi:hypothetical protein
VSRVCTICSHPKLPSIDRRLLHGDRLSAVARQFRISPDAVGQHRQHMRTAMLKADSVSNTPELAYGRTLIDELRTIRGDIERLQADAEHRRDIRCALHAIRERVALVEFEARLTGRIDAGQKNEFHLHFPPDRALAVAEAYVARHGTAEKTVEMLPPVPAMELVEGE